MIGQRRLQTEGYGGGRRGHRLRHQGNELCWLWSTAVCERCKYPKRQQPKQGRKGKRVLGQLRGERRVLVRLPQAQVRSWSAGRSRLHGCNGCPKGVRKQRLPQVYYRSVLNRMPALGNRPTSIGTIGTTGASATGRSIHGLPWPQKVMHIDQVTQPLTLCSCPAISFSD